MKCDYKNPPIGGSTEQHLEAENIINIFIYQVHIFAADNNEAK